MKVAFKALAVVCLLAIGGCGSSVNLTETPEWQASLRASTNVQRLTMQRDAARKYDDTWDSFDEAYWATIISAAYKVDTNQMNKYQFQEIAKEAHALRRQRQRMVGAAEEAAYQARRAANRSYSCYNSNGTVRCY